MAVAQRIPIAISLLPYMWRAWWRKLEQRGVWHGANTATVIAVAMVGLLSVVAGSVFAFLSLKEGALTRGLVFLQGCLNTVLLGWLAVPILIGSTTAEGRGLQPVRLAQYPLRLRTLLSIGLMNRFVQPVYWILGGASIISLLPLTVAPHPATGIVAGVLYVLAVAIGAWSVELFGSAVFSSRRGREMLMLIVLVLFVAMILVATADFDYEDGELSFSFAGRTGLLVNADATAGLLVDAAVLSPSQWVVDAAAGAGSPLGIPLLALAVAGACALALTSLRRVILHPPASLGGRQGTPRTIGRLVGVPIVIGPLVIKEVRYLTRTLDHLMGVGMGLAALIWILLRPEHMRFVLPLAAMNIVFNESAIPLNNFGLDGAGADRYRLLPISGRQALLTKNLAYFILVGIHLIPLVLAGLFKGGAALTLAALLGTAAVCLVTAAGGNVASIRSPAPRAFFNFDSKEQTGGGLALLLAAAIWLFPVAAFFGLVGLGIGYVVLGQAVLCCAALAIWWIWLGRAGRSFDESGETMRSRLTKE